MGLVTRYSADGTRLQEVPLDVEDDNEEGEQPQPVMTHPSVRFTSQLEDNYIDDEDASMVSSIASIAVLTIQDTLTYTMDHWKVILFGQALSFLLACNGAAQATLHFECSLSAPAFTMALYYFVLSLSLVPLSIKGRKIQRGDADMGEHSHWFLGSIPLYAPAWVYFGIAFLDVQANYLTVLAFRYTTLTSVTLFDALAVPSSMILSALFLQRRYSSMHLVGVATCMWGILYNVLVDYHIQEKDDHEFPNRFLGDMLAIAGGILFGVNDVLAEKSVRQFGGPMEYLGMLGFFATVICIVQAAILEQTEIAQFFQGFQTGTEDTCSVGSGILLTLAFVTGSTLSYIGIAKFLQFSEATLLSLSFLTGDAWAVLFSVIAQKVIPSLLFWVALVMTVSGVIIYEMGPSSYVGHVNRNDTREHYPSNRPKRMSAKAHTPEQVELSELPRSDTGSGRSIV